MKNTTLHIALILSLFFVQHKVQAQETVFSGMQSNWKKAQKNYARGSYNEALKYYLAAQGLRRTPPEVDIKIAQTYVHLNNHQKAVYWFRQYLKDHGNLPGDLYYQLAESLTSLGEYQEAIEWYEKYGSLKPEDSRVMQKIWRLKNIRYLYEDSVYYSVTPVPFNSSAAEYAPYQFGDEIIFVSDRDAFGGVKVLDGVKNKPFFKRYRVSYSTDSLLDATTYGKPQPYVTEFDSKHHHGPVSYNADGSKVVFTQSSEIKDNQGKYPVQLYYAERTSKGWTDKQPVKFEESDYTVRNPAISPDGNTLFFSARFPDSNGGRDIYKSHLNNGAWGPAQNLGQKINTRGDEDFPFVHANGSLFFASNGHGGLGGLDVFEVRLGTTIGEVKNIGYPVNTQYDDFGIFIDPSTTLGYLSSNRTSGGNDDDIFKLEVDLQSYPLTIKGTVKYRNAQWQRELRMELLADGHMELIDVYNGRVVYITESGKNGEFTLEVPYSSQYKIKVTHSELGAHDVSLDIPKNKKLHHNYEIIIVEEQFKSDASMQ